MTREPDLRGRLERQAALIRTARREGPTLLAQTTYFSGLGLALVLPMVAGAYLGHWLDLHSSGYSVRWTVGCLLLGVATGGFNVYWLIKRSET